MCIFSVGPADTLYIGIFGTGPEKVEVRRYTFFFL